jgi:hypothetical protein
MKKIKVPFFFFLNSDFNLTHTLKKTQQGVSILKKKEKKRIFAKSVEKNSAVILFYFINLPIWNDSHIWLCIKGPIVSFSKYSYKKSSKFGLLKCDLSHCDFVIINL